MSTQLPTPSELKPISSRYAKLWQVLSVLLTIGGLALIGWGGWIYLRQQLEASKPPPARILSVSIDDLETVTPWPSPTRPQLATAAQPEAEVRPLVGHTFHDEIAVTKPVQSVEATPTAPSELSFGGLEPEPTATMPQPTAAVPTLGPTPTATPVDVPLEDAPSLADNPLPVVQDVEVGAEETALGVDGSTSGAGSGTAPLTRIVAESINLDADVVEVGWDTIVRNGVLANVWRVADYAAGWHRNSTLPGQGGNIVLSAHHNIKGEVFRYTVDLEPGDIITLFAEGNTFDYVVEDKFIVKDKGEPEAVRRENAKWIGPFNEERVTLVTCWPYNNNTHRLIVIGKPVGEAQAQR